MVSYSLLHTAIALAVLTALGVGGPLFVLWRDNR